MIYLLQVLGTLEPPPSSSGDFAIGQDQLALISSDNVSALQQYGGASLPLNYLFLICFLYYQYVVKYNFPYYLLLYLYISLKGYQIC